LPKSGIQTKIDKGLEERGVKQGSAYQRPYWTGDANHLTHPQCPPSGGCAGCGGVGSEPAR
jgi:hypothetical protein